MSCFSAVLSAQDRAKGTPTKSKVVEWKLGVALYTFSTMSFPEQLAYADSASLKYVEGFVFAKAGKELKDTVLFKLSPVGIQALKKKVADQGLKMESVYIIGGKTVADWQRDFEVAKAFGVKYVTAEPPRNLWDSVDSLAGAYGIKVALHNHWKGNSIYWHPDSVLAALKGHPNFGACPDLGHYPKSGINPVLALKKLEGKIIGIHLKDIAEYNNNKIQDVPVGTGVVDFPAVFTELKQQRFKGYVMFERDTKEQPNNLASLRQMVDYYHSTLGLPR
ncbi:sugar phosphate isomerase/epimerase family protein [Runella slithyformis]|nr:sugar phosphate isomerase/epimerase family protein [Runella slithyformis]